jgi:hypothetical protein
VTYRFKNFQRRLEEQLETLCKPQVSLRRQLLAAALSLALFYLALRIYEHVPYEAEHFIAFFVMTMTGYAFTGSWRITWPLLAVYCLGNELVVDKLKPNHPDVDVRQILSDAAGVCLASWFLASIDPWLPGRPWLRIEERRAKARARARRLRRLFAELAAR